MSMARGRASGGWILGLGAVAALGGCANPEPLARAELTKDGYEEISLTPRKERGSFDFTAKKPKDKLVCSGTIEVKGAGSSRSSSMSFSCQPDESLCTPKAPADCYELSKRVLDKDPGRANDFRRRACDAGHGEACNELGYAYEKGLGVPKDGEQSLAAYRKGCDAKNGMACRNAGVCHENGFGTSKSLEEAARYYDLACGIGYARGCSDLAIACVNGYGVPRDLKKGAELFERACKDEVVDACAILGTVLVKGGDGITTDLVRGRKLLEQGCAADKGEACTNLAIFLRDRVLKSDDPTGADRVKLLEKGCKLDYASACTELGLMTERGEGGLAVDLPAALARYVKACDLGSAVGCHNLGGLVAAGRGAERDLGRAATAYDKSCQLGFAPACAKRKALPAAP